MTKTYLPTGRIVVVPENDLEERVVVAFMAALATTDQHRTEILTEAMYRDDQPGMFVTQTSEYFLWLEQVSEQEFHLLLSDE
jgi:hypothetical protein